MDAHGVHTMMNLFEGNVTSNKFLADLTHGSSSWNTLFRNRIHGYNNTNYNDETAICLDKYQRHYNIVGNVLGVVGWHTNYQRINGQAMYPVGLGTQERNVYKIGYFFSWNGEDGTTPKLTNDTITVNDVLRDDNWDCVTTTNNGIVYDPTVTNQTLVSSLYLTNKPSWFGNLPWPPVDPTKPSAAVPTAIPAGYRVFYGTNPPVGPSPPKIKFIKLNS
jgi:hypothetical protein